MPMRPPADGLVEENAVMVKVSPTCNGRAVPVLPLPVVVNVWNPAAPGVLLNEPLLAKRPTSLVPLLNAPANGGELFRSMRTALKWFVCIRNTT